MPFWYSSAKRNSTGPTPGHSLDSVTKACHKPRQRALARGEREAKLDFSRNSRALKEDLGC